LLFSLNAAQRIRTGARGLHVHYGIFISDMTRLSGKPVEQYGAEAKEGGV
jgi:hypothetical protein